MTSRDCQWKDELLGGHSEERLTMRLISTAAVGVLLAIASPARRRLP